jgi:hypothetical protein
LVIIFIFAFTGVYLKYVSVSSNLMSPTSLKMGAVSCQQKYSTLIFFCLFAGWGEHHGKQGWLQAGEDMCGSSRKVARFEVERRMDFEHQHEYI